jgi:hypothetical protein
LAANGVLTNLSALTFSFDEEPDEFRWVITTLRQSQPDGPQPMPTLFQLCLHTKHPGKLEGDEPQAQER